MKSIDNFILEKLKLNPQTKLKWTINDAKDGDIITVNISRTHTKNIYIFKCISPEADFNGAPVIRIYGYYNPETDIFAIIPPSHYFGTLRDVDLKRHICSLSTEEEKQELFKAAAKEGYKWDADKKEFIKIIRI